MTDIPEIQTHEAPSTGAPRPRLVELFSQDVTPQVDAAAKQMIAGGDALLVKNSRNAVHGFVLDQDHYDTRLEWNAQEFLAICSCETRAAGFVCPHLWATVLLADRSGAFRPLEEASAHPIFSRGMGGGTDTPAGPRRSPNAWPARAGWKIHLSAIAQASARRAGDLTTFAAGLPRQAVYVVDAQETRASHLPQTPGDLRPAIIVELESRHLKKSKLRQGANGGNGGGWTKPAAFRL